MINSGSDVQWYMATRYSACKRKSNWTCLTRCEHVESLHDKILSNILRPEFTVILTMTPVSHRFKITEVRICRAYGWLGALHENALTIFDNVCVLDGRVVW